MTVEKARHRLSMEPDWFAHERVTDGLVRGYEPYAHPFVRGNIWWLRGEGGTLHGARLAERLGLDADLPPLLIDAVSEPACDPAEYAVRKLAVTRTLTGDDDVLLDTIDGADPTAYRNSMRSIRELDVRVVRPGHGSSFSRTRLLRLVDSHLAGRAA